MPLPSFSGDIEKNIVRHIKYRGTVRTGEVVADNGDGTYDVKIALSDEIYPNVETIHYEMKFEIGEIAVLAFEYGSKELPKIIGHSKKIAQVPVEIEVDYSGTARVETLSAYSVTSSTAYLEARISLGGAGNCTRRGFEYGTTTAYGNDTHTDGSYGAGSYAIQITSLTRSTVYHFRAYIIDENGDTQYGDDKQFTAGSNLVSSDDVSLTIYIHSGVSSGILSSFASPADSPFGLAYDGTNLISSDVDTKKIYIHDGVSSGVSSSFASPGGGWPVGLAYDGTNLISMEVDTEMIYVHSGVTSGISSSFPTPAVYTYGLTYDGTNLISSEIAAGTIYIHDGVSSGVSSSFPSPDVDPYGLAYDGTNLISCDVDAKKIYIHSGVSSGVSSSFASPANVPVGLVYI